MRTFFLRLVIVATLIFGCVSTAGCWANQQNIYRRLVAATVLERHDCAENVVRFLRNGRHDNTFIVEYCDEHLIYEVLTDGSVVNITPPSEE